MTYVCPRVYRAPYMDGPLWIVLTNGRCRRYRRRWVAELVAFFVQRLGSNEPIGRYVTTGTDQPCSYGCDERARVGTSPPVCLVCETVLIEKGRIPAFLTRLLGGQADILKTIDRAVARGRCGECGNLLGLAKCTKVSCGHPAPERSSRRHYVRND